MPARPRCRRPIPMPAPIRFTAPAAGCRPTRRPTPPNGPALPQRQPAIMTPPETERRRRPSSRTGRPAGPGPDGAGTGDSGRSRPRRRTDARGAAGSGAPTSDAARCLPHPARPVVVRCRPMPDTDSDTNSARCGPDPRHAGSAGDPTPTVIKQRRSLTLPPWSPAAAAQSECREQFRADRDRHPGVRRTNTGAGLDAPARAGRRPAAGPIRRPAAADRSAGTETGQLSGRAISLDARRQLRSLSTKYYSTPKYADALLKYNQDYPLATREMRQNAAGPGTGPSRLGAAGADSGARLCQPHPRFDADRHADLAAERSSRWPRRRVGELRIRQPGRPTLSGAGAGRIGPGDRPADARQQRPGRPRSAVEPDAQSGPAAADPGRDGACGCRAKREWRRRINPNWNFVTPRPESARGCVDDKRVFLATRVAASRVRCHPAVTADRNCSSHLLPRPLYARPS